MRLAKTSLLKPPVLFLIKHPELVPKVNVCWLKGTPFASRNSTMKGYFFQIFQDILNIPRGKITSTASVLYTLLSAKWNC